MTIIVRRSWTRQPQILTGGVNRSNPLTNGIFALADVPNGIDVVYGLPLGGSTGRARIVTPNGKAFNSLSHSDWMFGSTAGVPYTQRDRYSFNQTPGTMGGSFSTLIVWRKPISLADGIYVLGRAINGAILDWNVQFLSGTTYPVVREHYAGVGYSTTISVSDGDTVAFLYSWETGVGATCYSYNFSKGILGKTTLALTGAHFYEGFADQTLNVQTIAGSGGAPYSGDLYGIPVLLDARWRRTTPERDAIRLVTNPWQLFAPRLIIIPTAAAAGYTHPTLSNARMGSLTSTTGVPLVDYSF